MSNAAAGPPPAVPYGPPVDTTTASVPAASSKSQLKEVGRVAAKIALPFVVGALIRALAKR